MVSCIFTLPASYLINIVLSRYHSKQNYKCWLYPYVDHGSSDIQHYNLHTGLIWRLPVEGHYFSKPLWPATPRANMARISWGAGRPNGVFTPVEYDVTIILHEAAHAVVPNRISGVSLPDGLATLGTTHGIVLAQEAL